MRGELSLCIGRVLMCVLGGGGVRGQASSGKGGGCNFRASSVVNKNLKAKHFFASSGRLFGRHLLLIKTLKQNIYLNTCSASRSLATTIQLCTTG